MAYTSLGRGTLVDGFVPWNDVRTSMRDSGDFVGALFTGALFGGERAGSKG